MKHAGNCHAASIDSVDKDVLRARDDELGCTQDISNPTSKRELREHFGGGTQSLDHSVRAAGTVLCDVCSNSAKVSQGQP
jgi:hypothetical protein